MGPRYLRDDGELLAIGRPRQRGGAASDARLGGQAGGQAEVRGVADANEGQEWLGITVGTEVREIILPIGQTYPLQNCWAAGDGGAKIW